MNKKTLNKIKQIVKCQERYNQLLKDLMIMASIENVVDDENNWDLSLMASNGMLLDENRLANLVKYFQRKKIEDNKLF